MDTTEEALALGMDDMYEKVSSLEAVEDNNGPSRVQGLHQTLDRLGFDGTELVDVGDLDADALVPPRSILESNWSLSEVTPV